MSNLSSGRDEATERVVMALKNLSPPWGVAARKVLADEGKRLVTAIARWTDPKDPTGGMTLESANEVRRLMLAAHFLIGVSVTAGSASDEYEMAMAHAFVSATRGLSDGKPSVDSAAPGPDTLRAAEAMRDKCLAAVAQELETTHHLVKTAANHEWAKAYHTARTFVRYAHDRIHNIDVGAWLRGLK